MSETGQLLFRDGDICHQIGQNQVKDGAFGIHHAAGQPADGSAVIRIREQEHGAGKHRGAVADDVRPAVFDCQRGLVVRIDAHSAGADDHFAALFQHIPDGRRDLFMVIVQNRVFGHFAAEFLHFCLDNRGEGVFDPSVEHLVARGHQTVFFRFHRDQAHDRVLPGSLLRGLHAVFLDDQRDHAGTAELIPLLHHEARCTGGDHHVAQCVDRAKALQIHQKQTVGFGGQFDLSFLGIGRRHMLVHAEIPQNIGRIVLVQHGFVVFPNIDGILAHAQKDGNILLADHMSLAEHRILCHASDNLGNVVTENLSDGVFGFHQFHGSRFLSGVFFHYELQ